MVTVDKLNLIRSEIERLSAEIQALESKGENKNVTKLTELARRLNACFSIETCLISGFSKIQTKIDLDKKNINLQDDYNDNKVKISKYAIAFIHLSAAVGLLGGPALSQALSSLAQGVDKGSDNFNTAQQSRLSADQFIIDSLKRISEELSSEHGNSKSRIDQILKDIANAIEQQSRTFAAIRQS